MKASQISTLLPKLANVRQPVMMWGSPGVGKSNTVAAFAKQYAGKQAPATKYYSDGLIDIRLSMMDSVDLRGIPVAVVKDGTTVWMTPDMFPRSGKGVIFLDEIVQAIPTVQSAASQLILDRRIGDYKLPDGWAVVAAGNRTTDRASAHRMPSQIANRFTHINYEFDLDDWTEWAFAKGINPMVIAFGGFKPGLINAFKPTELVNPTPRSWEFVSNILSQDVDDCMLEVIAGTVGEGAATEIVGFVRVFREMPDYETICKRPGGTKVPENVAARYAVATMLAQRTQNNDMKAVTQYVNRMPEEFQILTMNDMTRRNKRLAETSSYITWAAAHKDMLLNATVR